MYTLNMQKGIIGRRNEVKEVFDYAETDPTGRYGRFDEVLGKGAMKTVYKAIDKVLGMEVAWNQVTLNNLLRSADDLQRLYSEVHLLSTLRHDSIMQFYTSWIDVDQRTFNFITEMFTSGTLREYRTKYKQLGIRAIKIWARQILSGLVYLHGHDPPVIHRDIKCDNIFVNGHHGLVKIGDLGLAAILRGSPTAHSVIGTPEFMAPEMYEENYNELVDVYSYGMCVLEMVTSEYPYSECSNPAQIYKKVTSGKLPRAFYKVSNLELQQFIGKCLEPASNRLSAEELLLDPFLASDEEELLPVTKVVHQKPFLNENLRIEELQLTKESSRTNMTVTGKLNAEDGAIILKVKLSDEEGSARNVYFPFDTLSDTPMDVAIEMVKELEITDWEPYEIADMIDGEISLLVPDWEKGHQNQVDNYHILNYHEYNDRHRLCSGSSSSSSSQASFAGMIAPHQMDEKGHGCDWLHDDLSDDIGSGSPRGRGQQHSIAQNSTRFCPEENSNTRHCHKYNQCNVLVDLQDCSNSKHGWPRNNPRLLRNQSLVDMRSQLLHRTLVEEVNKRRLFKTAGAVEDVGFQPPIGRSYSQKNTSDGKSQRQKGRRALP